MTNFKHELIFLTSGTLKIHGKPYFVSPLTILSNSYTSAHKSSFNRTFSESNI